MNKEIEQFSTGLKEFDKILAGGFLELSTNIICGEPGSGKTILMHQMLFSQLTEHSKVLYLSTLSEPTFKMINHLSNFDFFDKEKVDQSIFYRDLSDSIREGDFYQAIEQVMEYVQEIEPAFVIIDSFKTLETITDNLKDRNRAIHELTIKLTTWGITSFFVGEYHKEEIGDPVFAIADTIIYLLRKQRREHYQRFIDIKKKRGSDFISGYHPFEIHSNGITVYPRLLPTNYNINTEGNMERISTGIKKLDEMLDGGIIRGNATMIAGSTGTGKTMLSLQFIMEGVKNGEKAVFASFQELPSQLIQVAEGIGIPLREHIEKGDIILYHQSPVEINPDIYANKLLKKIKNSDAKRIVIDTMNDIEFLKEDPKQSREYLYSLISTLKTLNVTTYFTNEIPKIFGTFQLSQQRTSFIADSVIILKYVELGGELARSINVLKQRGSQHDTSIRYFTITNDGIEVSKKFDAETGILTGSPVVNTQRTLNEEP